MKKILGIIFILVFNAMAMDKDGEVLFYRYFNGTEKIRKFKQSIEGKRRKVTKAKDTSTKKVRWIGKISDLRGGKAFNSTKLTEPEVKDIYKELLREQRETEEIYKQYQEYQARIGYGFLI